MPTKTYKALATVTLSSSASSVTFSSIPATYRDLVLVANGSETSGTSMSVRVNGDSGSNYSTVFMRGTNTDTAQSQSFANETEGYVIVAAPGNNFTVNLSIMDYSATDKHKTMLSRSGYGAATLTEADANRWANTAAITSVQIIDNSGTFNSGCTFSLYGIES